MVMEICSIRPVLVLVFLASLATSAVAYAADAEDGAGAPPQPPVQLEGTRLAEVPPDILVRQHDQIDRYWLNQISKTAELRDKLWQPDFSSAESYRKSVAQHRENLKGMLGLSRNTEAGKVPGRQVLTAEGPVRVEAVSIPVDRELEARVLLFRPKSASGLAVIAIPPAEGTREEFLGLVSGQKPAPWLTALLAGGATVAVHTTIERSNDHPWAEIAWNNQMSRRRFLHRLAFPVGRTMTGLEVEQVLAIKRFLETAFPEAVGRVSLLGDRQGGMTALYAGAVEENFPTVAVVDYFQQREQCWTEPVDRMLYGQLKEFGDAEVAALIAPRRLLVFSPPSATTGPAAVQPEIDRAMRFYGGLGRKEALVLDKGTASLTRAALALLGTPSTPSVPAGSLPLTVSEEDARNNRDLQFDSLHRYLRRLIDESASKRNRYWRLNETEPARQKEKTDQLIGELRQLMGFVDVAGTPINPRTRLLQATEDWSAYHVLLDVVPGLEAWGYLLVPRRGKGPFAAVIAQHGGGGTPGKVTGINETEDSNAYHDFARHLAEHGYVVFAPLVAVGNKPFPEAKDRMEQLTLAIEQATNSKVKKAAALGMMRTSLEQAKLRRIIEFLESLPFVNADRIGYYGLSYGGYSATWMTAQEPRLKATVISGHFNDWTPKITAERIATSYLRHPDEDFANWNVLHRFTHTELVAAMWPRAVCVEYGEGDAVTPPGWQRTAWREVTQYAQSWGASDRITRVYFDGNHEIHGVHVFEFLDRWLRPEQGGKRDYTFKPSGKPASPGSAVIEYDLDTRQRNRIIGSFFVSDVAPVFSGLAIQASRRGEPGDLVIRFGTRPGLDDVGTARVDRGLVGKGAPEWLEGRITPVRLTPGSTYYFEIAPEWGFKTANGGDYYQVTGPRPLGGTYIRPHFGLFYRALVSGSAAK